SLLERRTERLLDDQSHLGPLVVIQFRATELLDDHGEEGGRRREVEGTVQRFASARVKAVQHLVQASVNRLVVEHAGHVLDVLQQPLEHLLVRGSARELPDRLLAFVAKVLVGLFAARDADEVKVSRQGAVVGEVVKRGQQFAARQVARRPEDHQAGRGDRLAPGPGRERIPGLGLGGWETGRNRHRQLPPLRRAGVAGVGLAFPDTAPPGAALLTAWPPNWLRSAASTRSAN